MRKGKGEGGGGIPVNTVTPVYEDMHANDNIRRKTKKKLTMMRRPKVPRAARNLVLYCVTPFMHQASGL